jgi:glycolate oxidase FAD binding subunit
MSALPSPSPPAQREVAPRDVAELTGALSEARADGHAVRPTGGGSKLTWGNVGRPIDLQLSLARFDRVIDHAYADMTATVQAGCRISELQRQLSQHGQRLALDPLWPERATVGGVLSTNDSGALRLRFGGARDLLIGLSWVLADGTVAKSGGRVVKNVAGYDLGKLAIGALGTLGVVIEAVFRLHPLPDAQRTLTLACAGSAEAQAFVLGVLSSQLATSGVQLRSSGGATAVDVLLEGTPRGIAAQCDGLARIAGRAAGLEEGPDTVWRARQALWDADAGDSAIVKLSVLPADLALALERLAALNGSDAECVLQATGLGFALLPLSAAKLTELRAELAERSGSVVLLRRPAVLQDCDAFGTPAALSVMRALKAQLDPSGVLNPGRFVGGL